MCATHNVSASTLRVMTDELSRGAEIMAKIMKKEAGWADLVARNDFFYRYKHYLQIIASSDTLDKQLLWQVFAVKWEGVYMCYVYLFIYRGSFIESRLRHLLLRLESLEQIDMAHPYMKGIDKNVRCPTEENVQKAKEGNFDGLEPIEAPAAASNGPKDATVDGHDDGDDLNAGDRSPREDDRLVLVEKTALSDSERETQAASVNHKDVIIESKNCDNDKNEYQPTGELFTTTFYIGFSINPNVIMRPLPISDFQKMCRNWDKFNEQSMNICIKYVKG